MEGQADIDLFEGAAKRAKQLIAREKQLKVSPSCEIAVAFR